MKYYAQKKGFTLIEILVALSIIGVLTSVVLASMGNARKDARDKQRVSDLQQIKLALRLYADQYGEYPCEDDAKCSSPVQTMGANGRVGVGGHIDTLLAPYIGTVPEDPLGTNSKYNYYYDGWHSCGGNPRQVLIFARTMETESYKNSSDTICTSWGKEGGADNTDTHMVIVGESPE